MYLYKVYVVHEGKTYCGTIRANSPREAAKIASKSGEVTYVKFIR